MPEPYRVNEVGRVGLVDPTDKRPYELPRNAWNEVHNIRMIDGAAEVGKGYVQQADTGDTEIHALDYYNGPLSQHSIIYSSPVGVPGAAKIFSLDGAGVLTVVNKAGLQGNPYPQDVWVTDRFNTIPLATNGVDSPQCFYAGGSPITALTLSQDFPDWGPGGTYENATAKIIIAYKAFILAMNIFDQNYFPNMIAWSDAADPGLMPASWDYNNPATLAGRDVLGPDSGQIIAAKRMRDSVMVYTEYETYRVDFVQSERILRFTRVFEDIGAFGPRSVATFGSQHLLVSRSDIIVHDGQQWRSVAEERIRNRFFANLTEDNVNQVYASTYRQPSEIWIGSPDPQGEINIALVWSWKFGNPWSTRPLPNCRHLAELPVLEVGQIDDNWDTGDDGGDDTWDGAGDKIWDEGVALGDLQWQGASADRFLYQMDTGPALEDGYLERQDINLSGDETTETVQEMHPRVQGTEPLTITLGGAQSVEGPYTFKPSASFDPLTDYHITRLVTGRRHAVRFQGRSFRLEGYNLSWEYAGER